MNGNRKGPENKGSKTGRGLGFCTGQNKAGRYFETNTEGKTVEFGLQQGNGMKGRGMGQGLRMGRGMGQSLRMGRTEENT